MASALLIGNDINNVTNDYSWQKLVNGLISYAQLSKKPQQSDFKPFPLLYEEIYLNAAKLYGTKELRLKQYIASNTRKLKPNNIHERLVHLGIQNLMTTNYDLTLEQCLTDSQRTITNKGLIKEQVYNLFRYHKIENRNIWHIHGSQLSPKSITLGYEHYSGFLQQMRNYVASGTRGAYARYDFQPIGKRIWNNSVEHHSWVDFFFTHDVYIIGLNLDFVEMHLWWLLTYRARAMVENRFPINNSIYYYYPKKFESTSQHKLDLFNVNGITTKSILLRGSNKMSYYQKVLDDVENLVQSS